MTTSTIGAHRSPQGLRHLALAAAFAATLLGGCAAVTAQNPDGALKPVNTVQNDAGERLMLKGFDVVNYFTQGKHAVGSAQFKSTYEQVTFYFSSAENKALFDKAPAKYQPEYGGFCANGIVYGIPWGGDGDTWRMMDGKLYIFGGKGSQEGFEVEPVANRTLADKYWAEEVRGNNSFIQRTKRLILRVPHYKSGEDLAKAVAEKKAKGG